ALLVALDLCVNGYGFNPAADPKILDFTPPAVQFLQAQPGLWRYTTYAPGGRKVMLANSGWPFGLYDNRGYGSIIPKQYADYMRAIEPQGDLDYNQIGPVYNAASLDSPLLDLLNVKYILSEAPVESPKYRLVYDAELKIYENLSVAPRAFTLPRTAALHTPDPLAGMRSYDPRQYLLLEDPAAPAGGGAAPHPGTPVPARVEAYGPNEVTLTATVPEPAYLVLTDTYFEGWKAFIRPAGAGSTAEKEIPIYRADGQFRAVALEPGAWTVRFKYSPFAVKVGAFASAVSLLALVFMTGAWLWRYFYRGSALDSTVRRVAKNSLAPMALNLMNRGIDLVFAAFYLRLLGPTDAGAYSLAIVVIGWFEIWTNFGLNTLLTREVSRDRASTRPPSPLWPHCSK
ncbi:MAG: oligosaccharide flippase family protein, partial [Chloroflexi bacterium]|nr:oligosaccharide flippase family protein [Chloroflexota bacterium]